MWLHQVRALQTSENNTKNKQQQGLFQDFAQGRGGGQMLNTKIKGGSGLSTNYVIRCTKNPKGGGAKAPPGPLPLSNRVDQDNKVHVCHC